MIEKNALDPVEPGARGRGEVQQYPRMPLEPGAYRGVFMGGAVVDHYVQLPKRVRGGDLTTNGRQLLMTLPLMTGVGHAPVSPGLSSRVQWAFGEEHERCL
jgi:hypothetical protein